MGVSLKPPTRACRQSGGQGALCSDAKRVSGSFWRMARRDQSGLPLQAGQQRNGLQLQGGGTSCELPQKPSRHPRQPSSPTAAAARRHPQSAHATPSTALSATLASRRKLVTDSSLALHMGVRTAETMTTSCRALEHVRAEGKPVSTAAAAHTYMAAGRGAWREGV